MSQLRVLIVGASVAGPTAAYWFARAGAKVTVIERLPTFRTSGQGIDIRTCGVSVMRKMPGMEAAVRARKSTLEGVAFVDTHGQPYGTIRATGDPNQQSLVSEYEIFRGDLANILYDMTSEDKDISYYFGEQVASIKQNQNEADPVTVEFMNGVLPTGEYDLVVACDGTTSRTRAIGLGCGVRDYFHPVNAWVAYFTMDGDRLNGSKIGHGHSAVGGRAIMIGPVPGSDRTTGAMLSFHPQKDQSSLPLFREASKQGEDALKRYVAKRYEGAGWRTDEILQGMMDSKDFYASEWAQVKAPALYKGRFVMVGDSGYAPGPTGVGTSLALGGAYVLAGEICKHKGDLAAGLAGYEQTMRPIITDLQKIPPGISATMAPQTEWGIWLRNQIFAFVAWTRIHEWAGKWFSAGFAEGDKHKMPDYPWVR